MTEKPTYEELEQWVKNLESELQELKRYLDRCQDAIYRYDIPSRCFVLYNKAAQNLFGKEDSKTVPSKSVLLNIYPEDRDNIRKARNDSLSPNRNGGEVEYRYYDVEGSIRWMQDRWIVIRDTLGNPLAIEGIVRDETKRKQAEEELSTSQKQLSQVIDFLPDATFMIDEKGKVVIWNKAMESLTGVLAKDILGKGNYEYALPFFGERRPILIDLLLYPNKQIEEKYLSFHREENSVAAESCAPYLRNGDCYLWGTASLLFDEHGKVTGAIESIRDITERKQAVESLHQTEKYYRAIFETSGAAKFIIEQDTTISHVNSIFEKLSGYSKQEIEGKKSWTEFAHQDDVAWMKENHYLRRQNPDAAPRQYEFRFINRHSEELNLLLVVDMIPGTNNSIASGIDVTERKQQEEELRQTNVFLNSIVENLPNMLFLKDAQELKFVRFNRAGEDLLGYSRDQLLGRNDYDFFPKEQADYFTEKDTAVLYRREVIDIPEESIQTPYRGKRILHTKKVPILNSNGEPAYLLGISEDITERKKAEESLEETLENLRKAFRTTIQVLASAVETRDPYTAGHQHRSADLAWTIATEMELPKEKIEAIRMAAPIHDIGKLSVPSDLLSRPTKLSEIEFSLIKEHARIGYEILKDVDSPWPLAEIVYQHHERMDGSGYPRNLRGEEIIMEARILAVADVVEAMTYHRPYRPALGISAAMQEIEKNKGILYDAEVVEVCLMLFREKGYTFEK